MVLCLLPFPQEQPHYSLLIYPPCHPHPHSHTCVFITFLNGGSLVILSRLFVVEKIYNSLDFSCGCRSFHCSFPGGNEVMRSIVYLSEMYFQTSLWGPFSLQPWATQMLLPFLPESSGAWEWLNLFNFSRLASDWCTWLLSHFWESHYPYLCSP